MSVGFTHRITKSVTTNGGNALSGTTLAVGGTETQVDETFAAGYTDISLAISHATLQSVFFVSTQNLTLQFGGTDEIQQLSITGSPTGGTFTITWNGQTTSANAYNSTAAAIQTALQALSNVGTGNVTCSGGPLPGSAVNVTFTAALGKTNVAQMTTTDSLTGGSTPASSVSTTTGGVAPTLTIALIAGYAYDWNASDGYFSNPFGADVTGYRAYATTACRLQGKVLNT